MSRSEIWHSSLRLTRDFSDSRLTQISFSSFQVSEHTHTYTHAQWSQDRDRTRVLQHVLLKWQEVCGKNNHSLQMWWVEKHLKTDNMSNLEVDEQIQQKTILSAKNSNLSLQWEVSWTVDWFSGVPNKTDRVFTFTYTINVLQTNPGNTAVPLNLVTMIW